MQRNDKIATAIIFRGMAKNVKFTLKNSAEKESIKNSVKNGTQKPMLALSNLVHKAINEGFKGISR